MIIPTFRNITYNKKIQIERPLPSKGKILIEIGEEVVSYTKLGYCKFSLKEVLIPEYFKIEGGLKSGKDVLTGNVVATNDDKLLISPFDGKIEKRGESYLLVKNPEDFWLISGVSGVVSQIVPNRSFLIETQGFELKLVATSTTMTEGVLEVLPNPSELLEIEFMNRYIKNGTGKIVYVGNFLRKEMLIKAIEIGCEGILCGSCDRDTLRFAHRNNFFVGVLTGFGRMPTPIRVLEFLKNFNSKYCIVRENSENIFISELGFDFQNEPAYYNLKVGLKVRVLDYPYFGWEGVVEKIEKNKVYVRINDISELVETEPLNLIV